MGVIRLLLALSVLRGHSNAILGLDLVGGQRAVELFYMISGFYMGLILNGRYAGKPLSLFYSNRALRIFPVYWATLLLMLTLGVSNKLLTGSSSILGPYIEAMRTVSPGVLIAFAAANTFIIGQQAMLFVSLGANGQALYDPMGLRGVQPATNFLLLPPAWTLDLELMFYAVAPFLVRRRAAVIALVAAVSAGAHWYFYTKGYQGGPWGYRFFPFELWLFLLGALCYRAYERLSRVTTPRWLMVLAWATVLVMVMFHDQLFAEGHDWVLFPVFAAALPLMFSLTKHWKLDAAIGDLSYPVYLSHPIVLGAIRRFTPSPWLGDAAAIATILLSLVLITLVANPIEAYRARRVARAHA